MKTYSIKIRDRFSVIWTSDDGTDTQPVYCTVTNIEISSIADDDIQTMVELTFDEPVFEQSFGLVDVRFLLDESIAVKVSCGRN